MINCMKFFYSCVVSLNHWSRLRHVTLNSVTFDLLNFDLCDLDLYDLIFQLLMIFFQVNFKETYFLNWYDSFIK